MDPLEQMKQCITEHRMSGGDQSSTLFMEKTLELLSYFKSDEGGTFNSTDAMSIIEHGINGVAITDNHGRTLSQLLSQYYNHDRLVSMVCTVNGNDVDKTSLQSTYVSNNISMIATRAYNSGDTVYSERPMYRFKYFDADKTYHMAFKAMITVSQDDKLLRCFSLLFPLRHSMMGIAAPVQHPITMIVLKNAFHTPKEKHLYFGMSFINHSCDPNCVIDHHADGSATLKVVRDIQPGQQLTISYTMMTAFEKGVSQSQAMYDNFDVNCRCGSCDTTDITAVIKRSMSILGGVNVTLCELCCKRATNRCSRCHKAYYCSRDCQRNHWKAHRDHCQQL